MKVPVQPDGCHVSSSLGNLTQKNSLMVHLSWLDHSGILRMKGITLHEAAAVKNLHQFFPFRLI